MAQGTVGDGVLIIKTSVSWELNLREFCLDINDPFKQFKLLHGFHGVPLDCERGSSDFSRKIYSAPTGLAGSESQPRTLGTGIDVCDRTGAMDKLDYNNAPILGCMSDAPKSSVATSEAVV